MLEKVQKKKSYLRVMSSSENPDQEIGKDAW